MVVEAAGRLKPATQMGVECSSIILSEDARH